MIAKRVGAGLLAVLLILGAWVVRDRIIDDDDAGATPGNDDDDDRPGEVLHCLAELRDVCRTIATGFEALDVRIEAAGATLDELASADSDALWLTVAPLPDVIADLRQRVGAAPTGQATIAVASSPLALVVRRQSTEALVAACGDPVELACLADQDSLAPTFAGLDTASGMLAVAAAADSFGGAALDPSGVDFAVWARDLKAAGAPALSGGTAIQTIQTRPTFGVALGAEAELAAAQRSNFDVLYPDRPVHFDAVLMVPDGVEVPSGLIAAATDAMTAAGWAAPRNDGTPSGLPSPGVILAVRDIWEDLR
jgi:hypothetical protein